MARHEIAPAYLDIDLLLSNPDAGRAAVTAFLLGPAERCPESLTEDLHRIAKLDRSQALDILQEEARRAGLVLLPETDILSATPRNVALRTFILHPEVFAAAEDALDFLQPPTLAEFLAPEEGLIADLSPEVLLQLEMKAREVFQADLRGEFCKVVTHEDGDEVHVSIRHGAHLETREVLTDTARQIVSLVPSRRWWNWLVA